MIAATCDAMNYMPQRAPQQGSMLMRSSGTAEPTSGWFASSSLLRKVSTTLMPLLGITGACVDAAMAAVPMPASSVVGHDVRTDAMNSLLRSLIDYLSLPHDWDGYDGQPAKPQATLDALGFLQQLPLGLPLPTPMLAGSGTVGLYWDRGDYYASLEFEGDGTYTYLTDSPEGYGGADGIAASTLPSDLRRYLATLSLAG